MKRLKLFTMTMLTFLLLATTAHADDFFELSFATMYNPGQIQFKEVFEGFAEEVEKRSNGSLVVNVFGAGTITGAYEEGPAVKSGSIDMGPYVSMMSRDVPYTSLIGALPDLSSNIEESLRLGSILYNGLPELKRETDHYGIPIGFTSFPPFLLISRNEPIKTPEDLKGKRMLAMGSNQSIQIESWGAVPVTVGVSDIYIGLQRGMGEAFVIGTSAVKGMKLYETGKYLTALNYPSSSYVPLIINKEVFAELSESQQNIIMETAAEYFGEVWQKSWENDYDGALKLFEEAGCEIYYPTPEEILLWQEANKGGIPTALERAEDNGISREEALDFIDRTYDLLEANGFEVNRYTE